MKKYIIVLAFLFIPSISHAQVVFELSCPTNTTSVAALQSYDQSTGQYRQNYCIDSNGNVSQNITGLLTSGNINHTKYVDGITFKTIKSAMSACLSDPLCDKVDSSGAGTSQTNIGSLTVGSATQSVNLILSPGILTTNATINVGVSGSGNSASAISCSVPSAMSMAPFGEPPCMIKAANGSNLASVISLNSDRSYLQGVDEQGNNANNTTCGVGILVNNAHRVQIENSDAISNCTHGIEFFSTTQLGNQSGSGRILHGMFIGNRASGIYATNTGDLTLNDTESQNNGTPSNLPALTVTVSGGTAVTITSGSISTDNSLIGTAVRIGGPPGTITFISAIASTTSFTVSSSVTNGSGLAMTYGSALESNNSQWYITGGSNFGGSQKGLLAYCSTANSLAGTIIEGGIQFGNNTEQDLILIGSESGGSPLTLPSSQTGASNCLTQWYVSTHLNGSNKSPTATFPNVQLQDGGQNTWNLQVLGLPSPNQTTYAMQITESGTAGTSLPNNVTLLSNGNFSISTFSDTTSNSAHAQINNGSQTFLVTPATTSSWLQLQDPSSTDTKPNKWIGVNGINGDYQIRNSSSFATILDVADSGGLNIPLPSATGLQIFNTTTTCTTAAVVGATCTTAAISLPIAEPDTSYRVTCTGKSPTAVPVVINTANTSSTQFTITIAALTAVAASFTSYDCISGHN